MTDVVVLGAGAAGMMCAAEAGKRGASVLLLEHTATPGKKIRISGGGRCNFTNLQVGPENFLSNNPHFSRSALARYTPEQFISLVSDYGIRWHEKTLGQLFCDGSAQQIIDMLLAECKASGVLLQTGVRITKVEKHDHFVVYTSSGTHACKAVVVATGGLSIPAMGATGLGYRIAEWFAIPVITPEPALVPIVCDDAFVSTFSGLAGVSMNVRASAATVAFRENLLFTHRGLSGPAILQVSSYVRQGDHIMLDVLPDGVPKQIMTQQSDKRLIRNILSTVLPSRFTAVWPDVRTSEPRAALAERTYTDVIHALRSWQVVVAGTEGFAKAEVTRGGVDTRYLSSRTMEATTVPGLYFIGEVVDVTGWLGGYNFQWAWSSAVAAAEAIAERS